MIRLTHPHNYILGICNGRHDLVQQVSLPVYQASSLKVFPEILSDDMACGSVRATTPAVDVDGWPAWGNRPKSWLGESTDDGREVSVAGALWDSILELGQGMITGSILEGLTNVFHHW